MRNERLISFFKKIKILFVLLTFLFFILGLFLMFHLKFWAGIASFALSIFMGYQSYQTQKMINEL